MSNPIPQPVLIIGATSPIAKYFAMLCAQSGHPLILASRDIEELALSATDLRIRYQADVSVVSYDATKSGSGRALADVATARKAAYILTFQGIMTGRECFDEMMRVNCVSIAELFEAAIDDALTEGRKLVLVAISSVAGDRGRQSNYPYGSSKAALDAYLSGLRNRHWKAGIRVVTIKPGFVRTPMSAGKVDPHSPLLAEPSKVACDIYRTIRTGGDIVYTPWFWRPIMVFIRIIPEAVFKRLSL